jgi:uncharacterized protein YtpQ (UPF0354 family)
MPRNSIYCSQVRFMFLLVLSRETPRLNGVAQQKQCDKKGTLLSIDGVIGRFEQQSRIIIKYAVYMRQEVIAQLNHRCTLVAIQTSGQQDVKPLYQILDVCQCQQDLSLLLLFARHSLHTCITVVVIIINLDGNLVQ